MANNTAKSVTLKDKNTNEFLYPYTSDSLVKRTNSTYDTVREALDALEAGEAATNRAYDSTKNVQGYMVLQPSTSGNSVASQLQGKENYIIEVRDIIDLNDSEITIPTGCTLKFEGGELTNGTVNFQNTGIEATRECFGDDLVITGKVLQEASPEWFSGSDADKIEKAVDIFSIVKLAARAYYLDRTVHIHHSFRLNGSGIPNVATSEYGGANQYGTKKGDWSSTILIPTTEFSRRIAKTMLDITDTELDNLTDQQLINALRAVYKDSESENFVYDESTVKARLDGEIPSLISVTPPTNTSAHFSAVVNGISFNTTGTGIIKYVINGIDWSTPGGPSRPFVIENCNFEHLNKALYFYGSSTNKSTNCGRLFITGCNIKINNVAIQAEGNHALSGCDIQSNIIEQNYHYGIYAPVISNMRPIYGYARIVNNLLEGQSNPVYIYTSRCSLLLEGNYYEKNDGSTVTIRGERADQCEVFIQRNTTSTNSNVVYNITGNTVHYSSKGPGTFNLSTCVIDPSDQKMRKSGLNKCVSSDNGKNELTPVATFRFIPNCMYEGVNCLREIISQGSVSPTYTLQDTLAAGTYVLAYYSLGEDINYLKIGDTTIIGQSSIYSYETSSYWYRYHSFTIDEDVPAGTVLTLSFSKVGKYSTAYIFPMGNYIYGLPKVDITGPYAIKGSNISKGSLGNRPTLNLLSANDIGFMYYDTTYNSLLYMSGVEDDPSGILWTDMQGKNASILIKATNSNGDGDPVGVSVKSSGITFKSAGAYIGYEGKPFTCTFSTSSGYSKPSSMTIIMNGTTLTAGTDYIYTKSSATIEILGIGGTGGITGEVQIKIEGVPANS